MALYKYGRVYVNIIATRGQFEFMAEIAVLFEIESVWGQNSESFAAAKDHYTPGIHPWNQKTEQDAECIVIEARKVEAK